MESRSKDNDTVKPKYLVHIITIHTGDRDIGIDALLLLVYDNSIPITRLEYKYKNAVEGKMYGRMQE